MRPPAGQVEGGPNSGSPSQETCILYTLASNPNPVSLRLGPELEVRLQRLEAQVVAIHDNLEAALAAQEQLQEQLRRAVEELSDALRHRNGSHPSMRQDQADSQILKLESRLRGVEQRVEKTSRQVGSILESRIWRTLVRGSSVLTRFLH